MDLWNNTKKMSYYFGLLYEYIYRGMFFSIYSVVIRVNLIRDGV